MLVHLTCTENSYPSKCENNISREYDPGNHQEPLQFGVSLQAGVRGSFLYGVFFKFLWLFFVVLRLGEFLIFLKVALVCHWYRPLVSIYLVVFRSLPELKEVEEFLRCDL